MSGIPIRYLLLAGLALCCLFSLAYADEVEVNAYGDQLQMQGRGGHGKDKDEGHWGKWSKCSVHCGGGWQFRKCIKKGGHRSHADEEEFSDDELVSLLDNNEVEEVADDEDADAAAGKSGKPDYHKCNPKKCKWQKKKCNKHQCPGKWSKWSHCHGKSKYGCIGKKFRVCKPVRPHCFYNFRGALDFAAEAEEELLESEIEALAASPESDFEGATEEVESEAFGGQKHRGCKVHKKDFEKCNLCNGKWSKWSKERCGKFIYKKCLSCHKPSGKEAYEAAESEEVNLSDAELEALDADAEIMEEEAFDAAEAADVDAEAFRHPQPCNQCRPGQKIWVKKRCSPCHPKPEECKHKWGKWHKCIQKGSCWEYRKCKPHFDHDRAVAGAEEEADDFSEAELSALEEDAEIEEVADDDDEDEEEEEGEVDAFGKKDDKKHDKKKCCDPKKCKGIQKRRCKKDKKKCKCRCKCEKRHHRDWHKKDRD